MSFPSPRHIAAAVRKTRDHRPRRSRLLRSDRHRARVRLYHRKDGRRSNASSIWWRVDPPRMSLPEPRHWPNALPGGTSPRRAICRHRRGCGRL